MQLFYQPGIPQGVHHLDPEESRHCIKVLRKKVNDYIDLVDGQGTFYRGLITETNPMKTQFQIIDQREEPEVTSGIHLAVAPTKRLERMEWLVEKATELGVNRISFVQCHNSERNKLRLDRLERKAISAMKQSLKASLPKLDDLVRFEEFISLLPPETNKLLAHLDDDAIPLPQLVTPGISTCILIGPEGDFSSQEVDRASAAGFKTVTLGPSRLRTETAALAAIVAVHAATW